MPSLAVADYIEAKEEKKTMKKKKIALETLDEQEKSPKSY
jgi:hypothetical protein